MSESSKFPNLREIEERIARLRNPPQLEYRRPSSSLQFKPYTFNAQGKRILDHSEESTSPTPTPSPPSPLSPSPPYSPPPEEKEEERMASIRELSSSGVQGGLPTSIVFPEAAEGRSADFELKSGLLHRLPMFHGLSMEDANKHLREFQSVCANMQPQGADENILKMKAFPFSLADRAKDWLYELPPGRITSWDTMMKAFLEKYFPTSKVIMLRKRISGIQQAPDESYATYYERFQSLIAQCPQHQMKDENLLTCFYEGLLPLERDMLDAAAGGAFVDKSPTAGKELIANRALNAHQYEGVGLTTRRVNEIGTNSGIEEKLNKLTLLMDKVVNTKGPKQACGVCSMQGHVTDQCPQLTENGGWESLNAIGGYQGGPQRQRYDPYSNTYNPGWRDHPNFKWTNNDNTQNPLGGNFQRPQGPPFQRPYVPPPQASGSSNPNYDKMFEALTNSTQALIQGQQTHTKDIAELKKQMGQVVDFMGKIHETGKLPSTTIQNPKGNVENASVVTTRSGRVFMDQPKGSKEAQVNIEIEEEQEPTKLGLEKDPATSRVEERTSSPSKEIPETKGKNSNLSIPVIANPSSTCMPFPSRFAQSKKDESDQAILDIFKKVQVNLPLLEVIKQMPKYAKFLKELCTTRRKNREKEVVKVSENVSALIQSFTRKHEAKDEQKSSLSI